MQIKSNCGKLGLIDCNLILIAIFCLMLDQWLTVLSIRFSRRYCWRWDNGYRSTVRRYMTAYHGLTRMIHLHRISGILHLKWALKCTIVSYTAYDRTGKMCMPFHSGHQLQVINNYLCMMLIIIDVWFNTALGLAIYTLSFLKLLVCCRWRACSTAA